MQKGFVQLFWIFAFLVLAGFGGYYFFKQNLPGSSTKEVNVIPADNAGEKFLTTESVFTNKDFGFEFVYPKGMVASSDTEEDYSKRNNGDARKNFTGYIEYQPGKFLEASYVSADNNSIEKSPFTIWVFENPDNLSAESWFSKYWYYPFMWGDFTYQGKQKIAPRGEATISGKPANFAVLSYQEGSPKYVYIPKDGRMYLIRILTKDERGEQILESFKFKN